LARTHWLATILLAAAFASGGITFFFPQISNWLETIFILLLTAATLAALVRKLPLQNVLLAAMVIALIGGGISALGASTGIPFGPFTFGLGFGPQIFTTLPWAMPLIWIIAILNSRGMGKLILRPWRKTKTYGFWLIAISALLVLLFDLALGPFASHLKHFWLWEPTNFPATWQGAPLVNFLSWAVVTLLILAFVTPALINKQLSKRSARDFHPAILWLGTILFFAIAAALQRSWPVAGLDAVIFVAAIIFAIRGARW